MKQDNKTKITVRTEVKANINKAWSCFTDPDHITKWYFASEDWHAPYAENNLSVGGTFKITMQAKDGSAGFDFEGKYTKLIEYKLIEYVLADGRKIKITFSSTGNKTIITEVFDPEKINSHERQQTGWQNILDNYKKHTEAV